VIPVEAKARKAKMRMQWDTPYCSRCRMRWLESGVWVGVDEGLLEESFHYDMLDVCHIARLRDAENGDW
jgi:hypothetical protein